VGHAKEEEEEEEKKTQLKMKRRPSTNWKVAFISFQCFAPLSFFLSFPSPYSSFKSSCLSFYVSQFLVVLLSSFWVGILSGAVSFIIILFVFFCLAKLEWNGAIEMRQKLYIIPRMLSESSGEPRKVPVRPLRHSRRGATFIAIIIITIIISSSCHWNLYRISVSGLISIITL